MGRLKQSETLNKIKRNLIKKHKDLLGIMLYGSFAHGDMRPDSSIDLLIITNSSRCVIQTQTVGDTVVKLTFRNYKAIIKDILGSLRITIQAIVSAKLRTDCGCC